MSSAANLFVVANLALEACPLRQNFRAFESALFFVAVFKIKLDFKIVSVNDKIFKKSKSQ